MRSRQSGDNQYTPLSLSLFPPFFTLHSVPLITSTQFISRFLSSGINDNVAHGRKPEEKKLYLSFPANFTCPYIYTFSIHFTLNFYLRICTFHLEYKKKKFEQKWNILSDNTPLLPLLFLFCCRVNLNRQYDGLLAPATSHNLPPFSYGLYRYIPSLIHIESIYVLVLLIFSAVL